MGMDIIINYGVPDNLEELQPWDYQLISCKRKYCSAHLEHYYQIVFRIKTPNDYWHYPVIVWEPTKKEAIAEARKDVEKYISTLKEQEAHNGQK